MAILNSLPGIEVTICVDGKPLLEHRNEDIEREVDAVGRYQASRTVSKYIEAIENQEFTIRLAVSPPYKLDCPALSFRKKVDGRMMQDRLMLAKSYTEDKPWRQTMNQKERNKKGDWVERPLKFTKINTTSSDAFINKVEKDAKQFEGVGALEIYVYRCSATLNQSAAVQGGKKGRPAALVRSVHEEAIKGKSMSHGTRFGNQRAATSDSLYNVVRLDGWDYPIVIFKFVYRSKEALEAIGILEQTPKLELSPSPSSTIAFDISNLSRQQKMDYDRFVAKLMLDNKPSIENRIIKREKSNKDFFERPRKKIKQKMKTVVDLTEKSDVEETEN